MIRIRHAAAFGLTMMLAANPVGAADEPDETMPGRTVLIRNGVLAKFLAKPTSVFDLPDPNNSPVAEGATLTISDTGSAESDTYTLVPGGWKGLGFPAGSKGYKYKGAGTVGDPCKVVLVKEKVVKAVCKGAGVSLATPFDGEVNIVLDVGTDTKRYCARFGGTEVRNDGTLLKRKTAVAPASCAVTSTSTSTTTSSTTLGTGTVTTTTVTSTTIDPSTPCCGNKSFSSFISHGVSGEDCGTIRNNNGTEYAPVVCGGMYVGGGGNSITLPLSTPNNLHWVVELTSCTGQTATVGPTTATETNSNLRCTDIGCFFGGPLTIPNSATTPASACVIITVATPASGTMDCGTGEAQIDMPLDAAIYLTGDTLPLRPGIQPCPLCTGGQVGVAGSGVCEGGLNNGMSCTPANTDVNGVNGMDPSYPTSHDCPPLLNASIGSIPIALAVDSGSVSWTAVPPTNPSSASNQTRVFCGYCRNPETGAFANPFQQCWQNGPFGPACTAPFESCQQRSVGAFGPNGGGVKTITAVGIPAGPIVDGLSHDQTLASVFCIPPTFTPTVDAGADLGGPAAAALHGVRKLCSTANPCP